MKVVKIPTKSNVNRKLITGFGDAIYHNPEVSALFIKVKFKDGSSISFKRDEEEDDWSDFMKDD